MEAKVDRKPLIAAGVLIGVGMGGFVDGILFHQILQVHGMLSARYARTTLANVEVNMFWDGLFHAFTWIMNALGLALLWRCGRRVDVAWSTRTFLGSLLLGAGVFNLIEGIIDHHILHIHHVVERLGPSAWDLAFLAVGGCLLIVIGWAFIRAGREDAAVRGRPKNDATRGA